MANEPTFSITRTRFDEDYSPSATSRVTTNFANLARGERRQENLRGALAMIDARCNELAGDTDRFRLELDIVSVTMHFGDDERFPLIEVLDVTIVDQRTGERHQGILGNNFSSYLRDYDFAVLLPSVDSLPDDFGHLHGQLFQRFLESDAFRSQFDAEPVVCISVSTSQTYRQTGFVHPVLGAEYEHEHSSLTDVYFGRMGMQVRYFRPAGSKAPLAFYTRGDLTSDYTDLQLIGTISTMETFQKIYRPEIYNAHATAADVFRPTLDQSEWTSTGIAYDREERSRLGITQGRYTEEHLVRPHRDLLEQWASAPALTR